MVNIYDKKNELPYYIVGSLATLALLASGVFAAAPAILTALPSLEFLAPVVTLALSLGTPLIAVCAVFSAVVIALSYKAVSKNKALAEKETQLAGKTQEIEAQNKTLAEQRTQLTEQETQLTEKAKEIEAANKAIAGQETQLAEKDAQLIKQVASVSEERDKLIEANRMLQEMLQEEDNRFAESLFENISGDGVTQPRNDLLSADEMAAESGPDAQPVEVPKQIGSGWFSQRQVLGARIGATLGFAGLLAQCFIGPVANALPPANDFTGVDDLHNDSFSISEAGIVATFGFMGLVAQYFIGSIASALSFANKPINSVSPPANSFNPETTLDKELNQINDTLKAAAEKAQENFNVDPGKDDFVNKAPEEFTVPQANGTVVEGSTEVGQNDPTQGCTVIQARGNSNRTVLDFVPTLCPLSAYQVPLPGLQHVALCCPSIPRSAPPSGP